MLNPCAPSLLLYGVTVRVTRRTPRPPFAADAFLVLNEVVAAQVRAGIVPLEENVAHVRVDIVEDDLHAGVLTAP